MIKGIREDFGSSHFFSIYSVLCCFYERLATHYPLLPLFFFPFPCVVCAIRRSDGAVKAAEKAAQSKAQAADDALAAAKLEIKRLQGLLEASAAAIALLEEAKNKVQT